MTVVQLIERGLAMGEGSSGGSEYTGLAGIAHAYLNLCESLTAIAASHEGSHSQALQMLTASQEAMLSKAAEIAELARAHPEVQDLNQCYLVQLLRLGIRLEDMHTSAYHKCLLRPHTTDGTILAPALQRMTFLEGAPGILCIRAAVYKAQGLCQRARETAQVQSSRRSSMSLQGCTSASIL